MNDKRLKLIVYLFSMKPTFADRINNIPDIYIFREISEKTKATETKTGKKVTRLHIGTPDLPTPYQINDAIADAIRNPTYSLGYPDDFHPYKGLTALREALVKDYREKHGVDLNIEQLIMDFGAKPLLHNAPRLVCNAGDIMATEDPKYPAYEGGIALTDAEILTLPLKKEDNYEVFLSNIPKDTLKKVKGVYICRPNNPTGALAERKFLFEFIEDAYRLGKLVVFDVAYKNFTLDPTYQGPSAMEVPEAEDVVIEVGSFSKRYNMVGHRLGWAVGSEELISKLTRFKSFIDSGVTNAIQVGGVEALTNPDVNREVKKQMKIYSKRADILVEGFNSMGLKCEKPKSTPYIWVKVPDGTSSTQFTDLMFENAQVSFLRGDGLGPSGEGYFRATIFQPEEILKDVLQRMETALYA